MGNWMQSVAIAEKRKAKERKKTLEKCESVNGVFQMLQEKYSNDGIFNFDFKSMVDTDLLQWCKVAICYTDIKTIKSMMLENGKIIHFHNGIFSMVKSNSDGNLYQIYAK